jgi:hypothetical protein
MMKSLEEVAAQSTLTEKAQATTYQLTMRSTPHPIDETIRLRRLLKSMLRQFGFRALRVERIEEHAKQ